MENEKIIPGGKILDYSAYLSLDVSSALKEKGDVFSNEIAEKFIADFKKDGDRMVHVSTFAFVKDTIYMTYYANPITEEENPAYHTARLVFCKKNDVENKTYLDLQSAGDMYGNKTVDAVYDTILMHKDDETLYLMWTANISGNYYRLYRTFSTTTGELGEIKPNKLVVNGEEVDFCFSGIQDVFTRAGLGYKKMYSDIGIMQKLTSRVENGKTYYYSGAYSGDLNFIIKSCDLISWEYVSMPDFLNNSKWENAVYVVEDKCFYFVRQQDDEKTGFLTCLNLNENTWEKPVLVEDSQSRSDFIMYKGNLYLFHAPINREYIGCVKIDMENIANSKLLFQAKMKESCFYPYVHYGKDKLYMSYTVNRKHIKLAEFDPEKCF